MKLGNNIYILRTRKGLSQGDLADALQVSRQSISKWETGGATPDLDKLLALCDLFDVTLDELVRGEIVEGPALAAEQTVAEVSERDRPQPAASAEERTSSIFRTVLICVLVVLGILYLPAIFFSPGSWPGILLLIVIGGLFYAVVTRTREQEQTPAQTEQERKKTNRKRLIIVLLCLLALLVFVMAYIFTTRDPIQHAQAIGTTTLVPRKDAPIEWVACNGRRGSVSYTVRNTASVPLYFYNEQRRIEVKRDGKWHILKQLIVPVYVDDVFQLNAGESRQDHFYFQQIYGRLLPGEYRMMFCVRSANALSAESYWIAKEFTIK